MMDEPAARFAAALARLLPEGGPIGLAVSGGADSLAMLLLAARAVPGRFCVATVDHGLRPAAAEECALVQRVCQGLDVPCAILKVSVPPGNVQAQARAARYAALDQWGREQGLAALATAHQADDQVETVLMRLARGSGVAGLAGIRERGMVPGGDMPLIRPILGFSRAECEAIVRAAGLDWARDPSNADTRFDRVRVRQALANGPGIPADGIATSAAACADADAALQWAADREWAERVEQQAEQIVYRPGAPRAIALRVVERAIAELGGTVRGSQAADLLDRLAAGDAGNAGGVLARATDWIWVFRPEPPRRA